MIEENFSGDTVRVLQIFLEPLKKLFVDFVHQNLNTGKRSVGWKDVEEKNLVMIARSFLKLCRYYYLIPHLLNIEQLQEFMEQTLPPVTNGELEFYSKKTLIKAFDEDKNYQTTRVDPMKDRSGEECEPGLHFNEFMFILGVIAHHCVH